MRATDPAARLVPAKVRQLRWELRSLMGRSPMLARTLMKNSGAFPTSETEIVIDGFPRTGNTFAVVAFQLAQPRTVSIAHHVHAPASIIHAVRAGIPAIGLVRRPEDAVLSFVLRYPHISIQQALRTYARFYEPLITLRDRFVQGPFEEITTDLGAVIERVNLRFGTLFVPFDHTDENVIRAQEVVEQWDRGAFGDEADRMERGRASPTEARDRMKEDLRSDYGTSRLASARARAERAYGMLVER